MEKTRFSSREKRILLFLYKNDENGYQSIKTIFALDPIKTYRRTLKSGEMWEHHYHSKDSIRRTLLKLRKKGYLIQRRGGSNWTFYKLTGKGKKKAEQLNSEITAFIEEWQPLLSPGTDIKP